MWDVFVTIRLQDAVLWRGDRVKSEGQRGIVVNFDGDGDPIISFDDGFTGPRRAETVVKLSAQALS